MPIRPFLSGLILIDFLYALGGQCMTVPLWTINRRLGTMSVHYKGILAGVISSNTVNAHFYNQSIFASTGR